MDKTITQKDLKTLIDAVPSEKVVDAFKIMEIMRTCYPAGNIGDITNTLPGLGMRNDYHQTELAFMFVLGQLYQTTNSKTIELLLDMLINDYQLQYLRYKEMHDNAKDPYEKSTYYGLMSAYSNIVFDLTKKRSELG